MGEKLLEANTDPNVDSETNLHYSRNVQILTALLVSAPGCRVNLQLEIHNCTQLPAKGDIDVNGQPIFVIIIRVGGWCVLPDIQTGSDPVFTGIGVIEIS